VWDVVRIKLTKDVVYGTEGTRDALGRRLWGVAPSGTVAIADKVDGFYGFRFQGAFVVAQPEDVEEVAAVDMPA
jgi:hypothetical protein